MGGGASTADSPENQQNNSNQQQTGPADPNSRPSKATASKKKSAPLKTNFSSAAKEPKTSQKQSATVSQKKTAQKKTATLIKKVLISQLQLNPLCEHGKPSEFVCLSNKCTKYPFYSIACEKQCENKHFHSSKISSVRLKQLQAKLQELPKISQVLSQQADSYRQTLEQLRQAIEQFVQAQLQKLDKRQAGQKNPQDIQKLSNALQQQKYAGITGSCLAAHWQTRKQDTDHDLQEIEFLKQKQLSTAEFCQCFHRISDLQGSRPETQRDKEQEKEPQPSFHLFRRYKLYEDLSLGKEGAWSSKRA